MPMIPCSQVRPGMILVGVDGRQLYRVLEADPPSTLRLRSLHTGIVETRHVGPNERFEHVTVDRRELQYVYEDGDSYVFLDTASESPVMLPHEWGGRALRHLQEGDRAHVVFHRGEPLCLEQMEGSCS